MEDQRGSLKETELYPNSPCGFMILVIVFRSWAPRSSLWMKVVLEGGPRQVFPCTDVSLCLVQQSLQSCPNLLGFSTFQQTCPVSNSAAEWQAGEMLVR